jgi:apolipoprotein D and lipocalin family protein
LIAAMSRPLAAALLAAASLFCAAADPVQTVPQLDLRRYAGLWYEIARLPDDAKNRCAGDVTVNYAVRKDGRMAVTQRCRMADGHFDTQRGVARPQKGDVAGGARLEMKFAARWLQWLPFGWDDHWVVAIDPDYDFAVVTDRERRQLWLMSRTPRVDAARLDALLAGLRTQGHPVDRLVRTPHASLLPPRLLRVMT